MEKFSGYFWVFLSKLMRTLFLVFTRIFMRFYCPEAMNSACSNFSHENHQTESNHSESKTEAAAEFSDSFEDTELKSETINDSGNFGLEEEETTKLVFKFKYQNWNCNSNEEFKGNYGESCDFVKKDTISESTNKYEFMLGKSFSLFLNEPEASNFTVKELYIHSNDDFPLKNQVSNNTNDSGFLSERKFMPENCVRESVNAEILDNCTQRVHKDDFLSQDDFICSSSDSDSIVSMSNGFLSDTEFGTTIELDTLRKRDEEENTELIEKNLDFGDEKNSESFDVGFEHDEFSEDVDIMKKHSGNNDQSFKLRSPYSTEESVKPTAIDLEDSNRFDTLWEHQDLIEQMKMELKKVRATGLPTILEDSESPRIMDDLKPWKIDEKFQHGSNTNDLPKFYRSYRERMRKFDILNYQKMYAIGFLQSKDPLQSISSRKNSSPAITCILPQSFRLGRLKNAEPDPMKKFIRELYSDLEMVYVGQLCLSWEFLRWEYEKALKLWESDQYGLRRFNEVAGEFQQFQVLLQRFMENEPFLGPRVENYARNRCLMRNLLQVPVIREDNTKDKKEFRKREADKNAITSDMLVEILEESIRTIWRFIRADIDTSSLLTRKSLRETHVELQDPSDFELLVEIRTDLRKKEKRLRDLLSCERCILNKFKKHHDDGTDQVLYFFSQVDMKLVWRVLRMSKITTDQLAWCRSKLNKINFVNGRVHVEPSFLLFPS